jgi:hypothetical protein
LKESLAAVNAALHNHVDIILSYNKDTLVGGDAMSIVQFEVVPKSVYYDTTVPAKVCTKKMMRDD